MKSCIYEGRVRHTRRTPVEHTFDYRLFLMYLDLDELSSVFARRWLWSASRPALARFRRKDHIGPDDEPLDVSVRQLVEAETGLRPAGPIRLLTNLSYYGYCFNPVSFYYCFDECGEFVEFIVAEVNNTPWGETDTYVLRCEPGQRSWRFAPRKKMHVSPFMPMDIDYRWALSGPGERLSVYMANSRNGSKCFDAAMSLEQRPIDGQTLAGILIRYPFMTLKVMLGIHWEALRLWAKRCPVYEHPEKRKEVTAQ
jgi:DUF1365 family protein